MTLVDPEPTPVVSGVSPVTAGDVSFVVDRLRALPPAVVQSLAGGSLRDPMCRVCFMLNAALRVGEITEATADELKRWHGNDALRCGVIYGAAAALVAADELSETLRFYANRGNYVPAGIAPTIWKDNGRRARAALAAVLGEQGTSDASASSRTEPRKD